MTPSQQRPFKRSDDDSWVEGFGKVVRLLPNDKEGSRHQRFILDLRNGATLLVVHNLDISRAVPVGLGDRVLFRGVYEWNDLGGLIHWTHHDPHGIEPGGYLKVGNKTYQ